MQNRIKAVLNSKSLRITIIALVILLAAGYGIKVSYFKPEAKKEINVEQIASLREAIALNNIAAVEFLTKHGAEIEQRFTYLDIVAGNKEINPEEGFTSLGWALYSNRPEIASYLINNGADVKASVPVESSLLYWAIAHQMNDVALLLIEKGADINSDERYNPAQHADINGMPAVVKKLEEKGVFSDSIGAEDLD